MADPDAAEDVVAEAFLLAARSFAKFDPARSKFSTWVTSIAINCMNSYYRKHRPQVSLEDVGEGVAVARDEHEDVENRQLIEQLMGVLSMEERELVLLKYRSGLRNVDIARQLSMNASTVATKLAAALAKMRAAAERGR